MKDFKHKTIDHPQNNSLESIFRYSSLSKVKIYTIDPLRDARWPELLQSDPRASVFHTTGWLEALRRTYGCEPTAFTTSAPEEKLQNGVVFCRVKDWVRGCRMVSVPFSDHCQPLINKWEEWDTLVSALKEYQGPKKWKYIEFRSPTSSAIEESSRWAFAKGDEFLLHKLDLRPGLNIIFQNFHKDCVQRKIHRAERENLEYETGRSESLLAKFYDLLLVTRRRHQLPPQPLVWFRNLADCVGDQLVIHVASKNGQPIASILTMFFKNSLVYKYGCSNAKYHNLGSMQFLFWKTIQEGKGLGAQQFDLGRSELHNEGLVNFKNHLGAIGSRLLYLRIERDPFRPSTPDWKVRCMHRAFEHLPNLFLKVVGNHFYRYTG
jgi:hypothetical protein